MNKKLIAIAVAGLFAAPAVALAQSSVTISGYMKAGVDNYKISSASAARAGFNTSENRVTDHSSRLLFNVREDLGGGMMAVGQFDLRINLDAQNRGSNAGLVGNATAGSSTQQAQPANGMVNGGNQHIGLTSNAWGSVRFGRQDTHYGNMGDTLPSKGGHLGAWSSALFDVVMKPGGTAGAIAGQTRTPNLVWYDSPKWGGFNFMVGYSTNPIATSKNIENEADLNTGFRKGRGWTFNPVYNGGNWEIAWSHWDARSDNTGCTAAQFATGNIACVGVTDDQRGDSIRGHYIFPMGIRAGLAYNKSRLKGSQFTGTGVINPFAGRDTANRDAWALPLSYAFGAHTVYYTYTKANNSKDVSNNAGVTTSGSNTGANLNAFAYNYDLSKRTSVGLTYAVLKNKSAAAYQTFYTADSAFGGVNAGVGAGEDIKLMGFAMRHNF